jgi:hypothetical protein
MVEFGWLAAGWQLQISQDLLLHHEQKLNTGGGIA